MFYVYAGFEEKLNRLSLDKHNQIFIVKFGFCDELKSWDDRFNDGFKNKDTGVKESLSLALHKGWRRIATTKAGDWNRIGAAWRFTEIGLDRLVGVRNCSDSPSRGFLRSRSRRRSIRRSDTSIVHVLF